MTPPSQFAVCMTIKLEHRLPVHKGDRNAVNFSPQGWFLPTWALPMPPKSIFIQYPLSKRVRLLYSLFPNGLFGVSLASLSRIKPQGFQCEHHRPFYPNVQLKYYGNRWSFGTLRYAPPEHMWSQVSRHCYGHFLIGRLRGREGNQSAQRHPASQD